MNLSRTGWLAASVFCLSVVAAAAPVFAQAVPSQRQAAAPGLAGAANGRPPAAQPPFALSPDQQVRVDQILNFWETRSGKIKTFRCNFRRWEYDPVFGPRHDAKTISDGSIKYAAPDKGLFRVTTMFEYQAPEKPDNKSTYEKQPTEITEHWICDGQSIFEFSAQKKRLIETRLPPDMQGQAITDGPLPFLFGAKADKLKSRYWIREMRPPEDAKGQYWLEAVPKTRRGAANFKYLHVILDEKHFLPVALRLYSPNGKGHTVYQFTDRKVNDLVDDLRRFTNSFIRPSTPLGWKKVVEDYSESGAADPQLVPLQVPAEQARQLKGAPAQR